MLKQGDEFEDIEAEHCLITLSYTPLSCAQRRMKAFLFSAVCSAFSTSFASLFAPLAFAISQA